MTVTEGDQTAVGIKVEAEFDSFLRALLDGKELDKANYDLQEGSIIVTLKPEYVKTLAVGEHVLSVETTSGSAELKFEVKAKSPNPDTSATPAPTTAPAQPDNSGSSNLPATGDTSAVALVALLMTASGLAALAIKRRKNN